MGTWPAAGNLAERTLTQLWGFSMAFQRRKIAAALAYAVGVGTAATLLTAAPAHAQDLKVNVTGSNVKRVDNETASPIDVITRQDIERAVKEVKGPLSVNQMDAITGMKTELIPIPELARMGVGRVSIPVASIMVAHKALADFFKALKAAPAGNLAGQSQWVSTFEEYTDFVGLKDYKAMEDKFLPKERMEDKYKGADKIVSGTGR